MALVLRGQTDRIGGSSKAHPTTLDLMVNFVLASASSGRLGTLIRAGVTPRVMISDVDEDAVIADLERDGRRLKAPDVAGVLARAKCLSVVDALAPGDPADVVLGCDSVLEFDGEVHGKPHTPEVARARWRAMRGSSGVLHSGHHLVRRTQDGADQASGVASTTVHFADVSDAEIDSYVETGEPLYVAGGFTVDGLGGPYITGIEGDYHAVVGVSLPMVRDLLHQLGLRWHDLRP